MCQRIKQRQAFCDDALRGLLQRIVEKDQAAIADLYRETGSLAFSVARQILNNREAAEEAVQDAYLQIWRRARSFDPRRGNPLAWIVTIVRTRSLDRLRRLARERREAHVEPEKHWKAVAVDPRQGGMRFELRRVVAKALDQLKREQRTLVEYAYYGGLSHSEMAARAGIPLGTVKTRLRSAMQALRESLRPYQFADAKVPQAD